MYDGKKIDMHAHIYPAKIALKAMHSIEAFYGIDAVEKTDGTPETLLALGKKVGVERFLVHSTATKVEQVGNINDFIAEQIRLHPEFIGFGTLHFAMTAKEVTAEVERAKSMGIRGIKLHPDCQHFLIDDPVMDKIYASCADYDMPILMHTGDDRYENSRPEKMVATAKRFPTVRFIAAHFGGYSCWDSLDGYSDTQNVWFDTCSTLFKIAKGEPERLIEKFGADRFFFGTDYPLFAHEQELARFAKLDLDDATQEKILYKNAVSFLKL
ncbi:MAG: amidohydrolase family protein [Clostridia bacterium]|nr:amidohydrolase family protein [Clostridia bacterium]